MDAAHVVVDDLGVLGADVHAAAAKDAAVFDDFGVMVGKADGFDGAFAQTAIAVFALHTLEFQELRYGHYIGNL